MLSYCSMAPELFDVGDEITIIDQAVDRLGIEPQEAFFLCQACGMVAAICSVFEVERIERGVVVSAYGRLCVHSIQVRESGSSGLISLGSQAINDQAAIDVERFFAGPADVPESWLGVVKHIYRNERSILWMADFSERLKSEWQKFLDVRRDRLGF